MRHLFASLLVVGALVSAAHGDATPDNQARAVALFEKAQGHYQAGQYQAAITLFQEAYDLAHDPVYLFNIAQSFRKVADCTGASNYYVRYLAEATDASAQQREKVNGWVRELQPCVEQRQREQDAVKRAEDAERQRQREASQQQRIAALPQKAVVDRGRPFRITGLAIVGVGAIGLSVGAVYSVRGSSLKTELADACAEGCDWSDPALQQKDRDGESANTRATIGMIGGGVMALVGTGLYIYGRARVESVMVTPTAGGAAVAARFSF